MEYRKINDLTLSTITFGAWAAGGWMWGATDRNEAVKAIQAGLDVGISSIDTAPIYGQGASEEIVGEAIANHSRDRIQLLTKFGMRWDSTLGEHFSPSKNNAGQPIEIYKYAGKESIIYECEQSLKRLKTDYIDLYQIHWNDPTTPVEETFEAVAQLIQQGKVRHAGVCNYSVAQLKRAQSVCPIVSNQVPYSMITRGIEQDVVPYCIEENIGILAYSPLERGLLTGKIHKGYQFAEGDHRATHPSFNVNAVEKTNTFIKKIQPIADIHQATVAQVVLRWTLEQPGITIALVGARNATQTLSNAKASQLKLSPTELAFISSVI